MDARKDRIAALNESLARRILVRDGAMGTTIQKLKLGPNAYGGAKYEGCNEHLLLVQPSIIRDIHVDYLKAGADILTTNTFNATPLVMAEYGLADQAQKINQAGAQLARQAADAYSSKEKPRWVAGSMGPTTKALSVTGGIAFSELVDHYYVQAKGLWEGGVDYFLLETCHDTRNIKCGLLAIERLFNEGYDRIPIAVSGTFEAAGTMLAGQSVEALLTSLENVDLLYIGLNCATGPDHMTDFVRTLSSYARTRVACVPNAGLPDEEGRYLQTPAMFAQALESMAQEGWLNVIGGCCGTNQQHIAALSAMAVRLKPRTPITARRSVLSGVDVLEVTDENRPVIVGERANVLGSKKFRDLIAQEKFDEASEVASAQVKRGAQIIDVSCAQAERDEVADIARLLEKVTQKVRVPLMIDSMNDRAIAEALTWCQGKAIINSINLEEGEKRFERVVPWARRLGAALVVGTIDESGQPVKAEQKLAIALRSHALLTQKYQMPEEDLYFDPLVFPCASGDQNYLGSAAQTIEAVASIKKALPRCKTVLGISNVSFGLPPAGREIVNAVFLYHCVQAGLDLAIVNSEKLERYPSIPEHERVLAENVLFGRGEGQDLPARVNSAITAFAAHFREKKPKAAPLISLPLDERLARHIVEGTKDGLAQDLAEKLITTKPLDIVNGPLMKGMEEVGRQFNANKLIVAEVLQSAEAMKAAVSYLEPYLAKANVGSRGKVLLATVKGDVHDIGKNLVDIVLSNNGFEIINLGTKIPPDQLIEAVKKHDPDVIGLSGLLVKSALQMITTASDLFRAGINIPLMVGGAAISQNFVDRHLAPAYQGTVAYAADAMAGLDLTRRILDPEKHAQLKDEAKQRQARPVSMAVPMQYGSLQASPDTQVSEPASSTKIGQASRIPAPPNWDQQVLTDTGLDSIWRHIHPAQFYGRYLGVKGSLVMALENGDQSVANFEAGRKARQVRETVEAVKEECRHGLMSVAATYRFFRARSEGDAVHLFLPGQSQPAATFNFPRQDSPSGRCLADLVSSAADFADNVCLFVVTAGKGIRENAQRLKAQGQYLKSYILQALALQSAEAYAQTIHAEVRNQWGIEPEQGKRYSFGFPACPRLEDQEILFKLLNPRCIGVELTEGMMMDPEASVSGIIFHHPQATYFSVRA